VSPCFLSRVWMRHNLKVHFKKESLIQTIHVWLIEYYHHKKREEKKNINFRSGIFWSNMHKCTFCTNMSVLVSTNNLDSWDFTRIDMGHSNYLWKPKTLVSACCNVVQARLKFEILPPEPPMLGLQVHDTKPKKTDNIILPLFWYITYSSSMWTK
jgi:hypothetical protein